MTLNMGFSFPSLISICTSKFSLKVKLFHLSLGTLSSLLPYIPLHSDCHCLGPTAGSRHLSNWLRHPLHLVAHPWIQLL